jgi:hypothetical protein
MMRHSMLRTRGLLLALLTVSCGDPTAPTATTAISFTPDASTCSGSGSFDLFIDGAKVGSPILSAGIASQAYPAVAGSHVVAATATSTGSVWPSAQVSIPEGVTTTFVLLCTNDRQLAPYQATLQNSLTLKVVTVLIGAIDTLAAGTATPSSKPIQYLGSGVSIVWAPLSQRYDDGSRIPDDGMLVTSPLSNGGTVQMTATLTNANYFSFSFTNSTGVSVDLGVSSNGIFRCLSTLSAGTYRFSYYRLLANSEVRYYKAGTGCTGAGLLWGFSTLSGRDPQSGFIALVATTAP